MAAGRSSLRGFEETHEQNPGPGPSGPLIGRWGKGPVSWGTSGCAFGPDLLQWQLPIPCTIHAWLQAQSPPGKNHVVPFRTRLLKSYSNPPEEVWVDKYKDWAHRRTEAHLRTVMKPKLRRRLIVNLLKLCHQYWRKHYFLCLKQHIFDFCHEGKCNLYLPKLILIQTLWKI